MRTFSTPTCQSRHLARRALFRGRLQTCPQSQCSESHGRRITILQCLSASIDPASLAQLTGKGSAAGLEHAFSRRALLILSSLAITSSCKPGAVAARAEEPVYAVNAVGTSTAESDGVVQLTSYSNIKQGYALLVPAAWDVKGKAGADVLFEDPSRRSTSVGITVNPVKVVSLEQFGRLGEVGEKLLAAERNKESTLDVSLLSTSERVGASGATLYEYEYELDSTRGRKRVLNTVTIFKSRLYILNATFKCNKEGCGPDDQAAVALLRRLAATFDVTAR